MAKYSTSRPANSFEEHGEQEALSFSNSLKHNLELLLLNLEENLKVYIFVFYINCAFSKS